MAFLQVAYASRPFGFDSALLSGILLDARRCNARDDITGALIARHDLYLQMLEGPEDAVRDCYKRILSDDRHVEITQLLERKTDARLFSGWAMRDDPAHSWIWTIKEVDNGAVDHATEAEVLALFTKLASMKITSPAAP